MNFLNQLSISQEKRYLPILGIILVLGLFLQVQRISFLTLPEGDEGSWMSVATEISRGEGFTTRWLEYNWLEPYQVPRPDDFRYPALTLILGGVFFLFGPGYLTALITILGINFLFQMSVFITVKKIFNPRTALLTSLLLALSPMQLEWNSHVLTESLFGLILTLTVFTSISGYPERMRAWVYLGICLGLLFLTRPNAILLLPGIGLKFYLDRKRLAVSYRNLFAGLLMFFLIISPWLIRNAVFFQNPFHIAGSAGLLRDSATEIPAHNLIGFLEHFGIGFLFEKLWLGTGRFFRILHMYEEAMEIIPFLFVIIGLLRKRIFYNAFTACGFLLSIAACFYASYTSWAGARYFSPFMPLVYAYGIHQFLDLGNSLFRLRIPQHADLLALLAALALVAPVIFPHRFYQRKYGSLQENLHRHFQIWENIKEDHFLLDSLNSLERPYLAHQTFGQVNFLTRQLCVGIKDQEGLDSVQVARLLKTFQPEWAVLTDSEMTDSLLKITLENLEKNGVSLKLARKTSLVNFYRLTAVAQDSLPPGESESNPP